MIANVLIYDLVGLRRVATINNNWLRKVIRPVVMFRDFSLRIRPSLEKHSNWR
jgi:hypothetical protein